MILADTSAWIEFLRGSGSAVCERMSRLLASGLAVTDVVRMEVLTGARDHRHLEKLRGLLLRARYVPTVRDDFEAAAALYRACRGAGAAPRSVVDCLVAAVAIRNDLPVLHADRDFYLLARHTDLRISPA